jgi:hypothetical protein
LWAFGDHKYDKLCKENNRNQSDSRNCRRLSPSRRGIHEQGIEPTLKELKKADPEYIIPCHCTGWKATNRIIETFPEKFIQTSVGTAFNFNV